MCLTKSEAKAREKLLIGKNGLREAIIEFHDRGYGNCGATCGHIIPGYEIPVKYGFKYIYEQIKKQFDSLDATDKSGSKGEQLQAMMYAAKMPQRLAEKYALECTTLAKKEKDSKRKEELLTMANNMKRVP
jgi:formate C-acetyltransferase